MKVNLPCNAQRERDGERNHPIIHLSGSAHTQRPQFMHMAIHMQLMPCLLRVALFTRWTDASVLLPTIKKEGHAGRRWSEEERGRAKRKEEQRRKEGQSQSELNRTEQRQRKLHLYLPYCCTNRKHSVGHSFIHLLTRSSKTHSCSWFVDIPASGAHFKSVSLSAFFPIFLSPLLTILPFISSYLFVDQLTLSMLHKCFFLQFTSVNTHSTAEIYIDGPQVLASTKERRTSKREIKWNRKKWRKSPTERQQRPHAHHRLRGRTASWRPWDRRDTTPSPS